jgi:uncharacterized protein
MSGPHRSSAKPCPICGKPAEHASRPFCSKRCADVDLNRWFSGTYTVPVIEDEDEVSAVPKPDGEPR